MITEAISAAALGVIVLGAAAFVPRLGGALRKVGYAAGALLIVAGIGLFFWPDQMPAEGASSADAPVEEVKLVIPPPSGELAKFSNEELAQGAQVLAQVIFDYAKKNESAALEVKQKDYTARFAKPVKDMAAELNTRAMGGLQVPPSDQYFIASGLAVALSGKLTGPESLLAVGNFLRAASAQVPTIAKGP